MTIFRKGPTLTGKIVVALLLIFSALSLDYYIFSKWFNAIELHEELLHSLDSIRVSATKLEYLLDMYITAGRFDESSFNLIDESVKEIEGQMEGLMKVPRFAPTHGEEASVSDGIDSLSDRWQTIKGEVMRLKAADNNDEAILIHNKVDMQTFLLYEDMEKLMALLAGNRRELFARTGTLIFYSFVGIVVLVFLSALLFVKRVVLPLRETTSTMIGVSAGDLTLRHEEGRGGEIGFFNRAMNAMLDRVSNNVSAMEKRASALGEELRRMQDRLNVIMEVNRTAGGSLSQKEIFSTALDGVTKVVGATAASIYLKDGSGVLRLKASKGFDEDFSKGHVEIPPCRETEELGSTLLVEDPVELSNNTLKELFSAHGGAGLVISPITYNSETVGLMFAGCDSARLSENDIAFFDVLGTGLGVITGQTAHFYREHDMKRFFERLINQLPFGIAVFDRDGVCIMLNNTTQKLFGADPALDVIGTYRVFDDEALNSSGVMPYIKRAYEGYASAFVVDYDPVAHRRAPGLKVRARRIRISSFPLYDPSGDIPNVVLVYEDLSAVEESPLKAEEGV